MPRILGSSKKVRSRNIAELVRSGRPVKQAVAIEFSEERREKAKKRKSSRKKSLSKKKTKKRT